MMDLDVVQLSRLQFGLTAMYHFIFVPLTLGMSLLLGIMETVYVITQREIWRDMTKFWGTLFGINFAMGVATGITMEFQFGTNWAYYSHYVGDIFGVPLAIEGLMAFFLEGTFIGLFFFGWNKLSKGGHLTVTWLVALGSNLSALWILIANGWMQHPTGAFFNFETMRMEISDFGAVFFNSVAQAKFVHTLCAGYITGAVFILAISSYYLLKGRHVAIAKRSFQVAAAFGLLSSLAVVVLGDESGHLAGQKQTMKLAAIEGIWQTEPAPASLTLFGIPDQEKRTTHYALKMPYVLGLIATRSLSEPIAGIEDVVKDTKERIKSGMIAYQALQQLKTNRNDEAARKIFKAHEDDLGHALLLKRKFPNVTDATDAQINEVAWESVPKVAPLFWAFRIMIACGFFFIFLFFMTFMMSIKKQWHKRWILKMAVFSLPLPWVAAELGWFVAEYGRQPWVIQDILPTFLGTSSLSTTQLYTSLSGFILLYTFLACVELYLMVKYIRLGPTKISPTDTPPMEHVT